MVDPFANLMRLDANPPGPVAMAFRRAWPRGFTLPNGTECGAGVKVISGPVGSAKTTNVYINAVELAHNMPESPIDGLKRFRLCTVRDTYTHLWKTSIKTWWKRFPKEMGHWEGSIDRPATHTLTFTKGGKPYLEFINDFVAIGDQAAEDVLRGYEPTCFYFNEIDLISRDALVYAIGRAGRYPDVQHGRAPWYGVFADFNKPDQDHWLYGFCVDDPPPGLVYFEQPSGLSPAAENLHNLPEGYYQAQSALNASDEDYLRRMIRNEWGYSRAGMGVHPEFHDSVHVSRQPLVAVPGLPLRLGADGGRRPAALIAQRDSYGRWMILDEVIYDRGASEFGKEINRILSSNYKGFRVASAHGDPALADKSQTEENSYFQVLNNTTGLRWLPSPIPNQDLTLRKEVVKQPLTELIDGRPALIVSPKCKTLRKALGGKYRYRRLKIAGEERYEDKPDKNHPYSDVVDALQALLAGGGEHLEVIGRRKQRAESTRQYTANTDFGVFAA